MFTIVGRLKMVEVVEAVEAFEAFEAVEVVRVVQRRAEPGVYKALPSRPRAP